jgi:uncharacterized protein YtpQ (UPF0354 family)
MLRCVDLLETHGELSARLRQHLQAVVVGDIAMARQYFDAFAALLEAHSRSEEELLMPVFRRLQLESNGCTLDILDKEHRKLLRLAETARERIFADDVVLDPGTRLVWIEETHMLKEVLEHHDVRERAAFNPALDTALEQAEAAALAAEALGLERRLEAELLQGR